MPQSRFTPLVLAAGLALTARSADAQTAAARAGERKLRRLWSLRKFPPVVQETAAPGGSGEIAMGAGIGLLAGLVILAMIVGSGG